MSDSQQMGDYLYNLVVVDVGTEESLLVGVEAGNLRLLHLLSRQLQNPACTHNNILSQHTVTTYTRRPHSKTCLKEKAHNIT